MNNVTMYTYTPTKLPPVGMPFMKDERMIITPELPFWWFLKPWKTCEDLQLSLLKSVNEHRKFSKESAAVLDQTHKDWSKEYNATSEALEQMRDKVYNLENELETVKAERDAANQAVRFIRNQRKKGKRRG